MQRRCKAREKERGCRHSAQQVAWLNLHPYVTVQLQGRMVGCLKPLHVGSRNDAGDSCREATKREYFGEPASLARRNLQHLPSKQ